MYLSIHVTIGAVLARHLPSPYIAFIVGFIGHFLTDMIPHGDSAVYKKYKNGIHTKRSTALALIDGTIATMIAAIMLSLGSFDSRSIAAAAIVGSILPDLIMALHILWEPKWLNWFHDLHFFMHDFIVLRFRDWKQLHGAIFQSIFWMIVMATVNW